MGGGEREENSCIFIGVESVANIRQGKQIVGGWVLSKIDILRSTKQPLRGTGPPVPFNRPANSVSPLGSKMQIPAGGPRAISTGLPILFALRQSIFHALPSAFSSPNYAPRSIFYFSLCNPEHPLRENRVVYVLGYESRFLCLPWIFEKGGFFKKTRDFWVK